MNVTPEQLQRFADLDENTMYRDQIIEAIKEAGSGIYDTNFGDSLFIDALKENGCRHLIHKFRARQIELMISKN